MLMFYRRDSLSTARKTIFIRDTEVSISNLQKSIRKIKDKGSVFKREETKVFCKSTISVDTEEKVGKKPTKTLGTK